MPVDIDYPVDQLQSYFRKHQEKPVVAFYGGEPCLKMDKMLQVMEKIDARAFVIQTNGHLLSRVPSKYLQMFHAILVSVDGRKEITDKYRGLDSLDKALDGARFASANGFSGDLIARMTVSESSNIFEEVLFLLHLEGPIFDHVHWQLDAMWDDAIANRYIDFKQWLNSSYIPGIRKLIEYWIRYMENSYKILGIVPFMGITYTLLTDQQVDLRCGAGIDFFAITTDGRITVCPIPPSIDFAVIGDITSSDPENLSGKVLLEEPCISCEVQGICGGRCLYTNKTKHWGEQGFDLVCDATKSLIDGLKVSLPRIKELINRNVFLISDFNYPDIPNGVEIIP
jgi:putative peptide-modifying radical SAM enzyme